MSCDDEPPPPGRSTQAVSPPPALPPAKGTLARRVRRVLRSTVTVPVDDALLSQAKMLDALFTDLLLNDAGGDTFGDRAGLDLALRAQKQCKDTVETIKEIERQKTKW